MNITILSPWARANVAFRNNDCETAITIYDEALAQRDLLATEKADLAVALQAETIAQTGDLAARDAESKAKTDAQSRVAALEKEKADLSAAKDGEIGTLNQEKNALAAARDAEAKAKADLPTSNRATPTCKPANNSCTMNWSKLRLKSISSKTSFCASQACKVPSC